MKKTVLIVFIMNVFLLMTVDVLNEYSSMKEKTQNIESSVRNSINASIDTVLSSEEFFADSSSYLSSSDSTAQISVWNGTGFTVGNLYIISELMTMHGGVVPTQSVYNSYVSRIADVEAHVYESLYGNPHTRVPSAKLKSFYDNVANLCKTTMRVRSNIHTPGYSTTIATFPSLSRMGLALDRTWNDSGIDYSIGVGSVNQFTTPVNVGRGGSSYYLTPSSLGVTYLDEELLRNTMYCVLDTQIRCNKVSNTYDSVAMSEANGTLPTQVYESGFSGSYAEHRNGAGHTIVNDGQVQYFMDTLDVGVTYYLVDWWDNANWQIVSYVEGTPSGVDPRVLPSVLRDRSTQIDRGSNYYVVVAKVDISVMVSLPYNSWVLQWNRHRQTSGNPTEYYGVLGIDDTGTLTEGDEGLVYKYTTFCAVTE